MFIVECFTKLCNIRIETLHLQQHKFSIILFFMLDFFFTTFFVSCFHFFFLCLDLTGGNLTRNWSHEYESVKTTPCTNFHLNDLIFIHACLMRTDIAVLIFSFFSACLIKNLTHCHGNFFSASHFLGFIHASCVRRMIFFWKLYAWGLVSYGRLIRVWMEEI